MRRRYMKMAFISSTMMAELKKQCDFSEELIATIDGDFELDGLTSSDVQNFNQRVESSVKQQEVRQGKSRKVASQIFSG